MANDEDKPDVAHGDGTRRVHFWRGVFPPKDYVGSTEVPAHFDNDAALSHAFAAFNRGSGAEVEFDGPSAAVGDVFAIQRGESAQRTLETYRVARAGFEPIEFPALEEVLRERDSSAAEARRDIEKAFDTGEGGTPGGGDRTDRAQRDLDAHDRMMANRAAHAARDILHDSTPFEERGSYTVFEARDRAAHTPSAAREIERQSTMANKTKSPFTEQERYLLDVQRRKDMAELYPDGQEGKWLRERARLADAVPDGPEARQIAEEGSMATLYADVPQDRLAQEQSDKRKVVSDVTAEQKANVDKALADTQLSDKIGGAADVGARPAPNDPTAADKSLEVGRDLQRQGVTMDKE